MPSIYPYRQSPNYEDSEPSELLGQALVATSDFTGYTLPNLRERNTGKAAEVKGTGNEFRDWATYLTDRGNDLTAYTKAGQRIASKANPQSLRGMGKALVDPRFLPKRGLAANIGAGLAVGLGSELVADYVDESLSNNENLNKDLEDARYHGDYELQAKIFKAMNSAKNAGKDARILADGVSTGSILGPKGVALGGGAAGLVVGARKFNPDVYHDFDAKFAKENFEKRRNSEKSVIKSGKFDESYSNVVNSVIDDAIKVQNGEMSPDMLDEELVLSIIKNSQKPLIKSEFINQAEVLNEILSAKISTGNRQGLKELNSKYAPSDPFEYTQYPF